MRTEGRHPSVQSVCRWFHYDHLPPGLFEVSKHCHDLAETLLANLEDGPELTAGLRKLLEAKDCFVRQAREDSDAVAGRGY
jgi:hypothetical protein